MLFRLPRGDAFAGSARSRARRVCPTRPLRAPVTAIAGPAAVKDKEMKPEKPEKMLKKAAKEEEKRMRKESEARAALYALHWHTPTRVPGQTEAAAATTSAPTQQQPKMAEGSTMQLLCSLKEDLKRMEKVAKDAVWMLNKEAEDGMHVVLVTANVKQAIKYGLQELPAGADTHVLNLGSAGDAEVPVATLRAMVLKEREEDSDSDSDEDEMLTSAAMTGEGKLPKAVAKAMRNPIPAPPAPGTSAVAGMGAAVAPLGELRVEGGVDASTAATLAFAATVDQGEEQSYPPMRSFL